MFHKTPRIDLLHDSLLGESGLPENYPVPSRADDLLFYIQRNHNLNTVIYSLNKNLDGLVNTDYPMSVNWVRYSDTGEKKKLNFIQNKLAFGYRSTMINDSAFEFKFVSYDQKSFYISKDECDNFRVLTRINKRMSYLTNVYAYAEDFGLFPSVKYIEFYGVDLESRLPSYQKMYI